MANTTNINIHMDADLKQRFETFCCDIPNTETKEAIQEVQQMKGDPYKGKIYTDVDQMMQKLLS